MNDIDKRFKNIDNSKTFKHLLSSLDLKNRSVLDIGCSNGEFLRHFGKGSVGLTISHDEVKEAKERGLDVRYANIEDGNIKLEKTFDVIFANNIFEHLYSPHGFLVEVKKFLKPKGALVLGVPCFPKISLLLNFTKFRGSLAVSHINFFTKGTLKETVLRGGWNVSEVRSFHMANKFLDNLLSIIAPHFYVVATPVADFKYHEKREKELEGYKK